MCVVLLGNKSGAKKPSEAIKPLTFDCYGAQSYQLTVETLFAGRKGVCWRKPRPTNSESEVEERKHSLSQLYVTVKQNESQPYSANI